MEFTLLGAVLIAVLPVYAVVRWQSRGSASESSTDLWNVALGAILFGVVVGRLAAMIGAGVNPITNPGDILIVRGGVATGAAATAALAWIAWAGRPEVLGVLEDLAVASLAGLGGWHAGCLVRGACLGTRSDLPWAIAQPGSSFTRHPVEIYAAILFVLAATVVQLVRTRGTRKPGLVAGLTLISAGGIRLATEPFRPALSAGPAVWYTASIVIGVVLSIWGWTNRSDARSVDE